ncbi:MAG: hypothetical protein EOL90_04530 [Spartobacteria bacterium]|nr:hypothetical protein [Spartobacteria bacterium]
MKRCFLVSWCALVVLGGCREKPAAAPTPAPAAGMEIALFQLGQSEEEVQNAVATIPNFRRPGGAGFIVVRTGEQVSTLDAQAASPAPDRPVAMHFRFETRRLVQAELTYRADDAAARGALYDRLLAGVAPAYAQSANHVLGGGGGRAAWLHAPNHMLLVFEPRADARAVTLRTSPPVFRQSRAAPGRILRGT